MLQSSWIPLMRIEERDDLVTPILPPNREGFIIEQVVAAKPENREAHFYRTSAGAERDLLLLDGKGTLTATGIKY